MLTDGRSEASVQGGSLKRNVITRVPHLVCSLTGFVTCQHWEAHCLNRNNACLAMGANCIERDINPTPWLQLWGGQRPGGGDNS